ncbi:MAG: alpha/beta fold hydrolase [Myxococcaceae bacterium]
MSILLLHGFTGHPSDVEPLKKAFEAQGFVCDVPLLPGHGTKPKDLNSIKMADWIDCAQSYDSDMIVGLSMGGLLAILLAAQKPKSKLILLSPAFALQPLARLGILLARSGLTRFIETLPKPAGSDIADPAARARSQAYQEVPLKGLIEFDRVRQQALLALPKVTCPVFSFFGARDHTVDVDRSSKLVSNPVIFEHSAHILPLDYDQKELISQCLKILEK